ncbi:hypothetical protein ABIB51_004685 [Arthrobacter sp. UYCu712]
MHMYMKPKNYIAGTSAKVKPSADISFLFFVHAETASCGAVDLPEDAEATQEDRESEGAPDCTGRSCAGAF